MRHSLRVFEMVAPKTTLPIFIFAYIYCFLNVAALPTNGVTELKLQFPDKLDRHPDGSKSTFGENAYAYVHEYPKYKGDNWEEHVKRRNYTAVLTRFDANGVTSNKSCNIEFKSGEYQIFFDAMVYSLHDDRITIAYLFGNLGARDTPDKVIYHSYRVLHMDTCKYYETDIKTKYSIDEISIMNHLRVDVLNHNDKFDVFLPEAPCDGARCKYTFSDKGEQISGPESFLPVDYKNSVLKIFRSTQSVSNFVFISDYKQKEVDIVFNSDIFAEFIGSQKLVFVKGADVTELTHFDYDYKNEKLLVKNSHGFLSVCRQYKSNNKTVINCMQFDENVVKLSATNIVSDSDKLLAIYNLPTGGILMAKESSKDLSIEKWSLDNKVQEVYSTNDFESKSRVINAILNVGSDGAICIAMYYDGNYEHKSNELLKKCYSKNVFSLV